MALIKRVSVRADCDNSYNQGNTTRWPNVELMLAKRRERLWSSIRIKYNDKKDKKSVLEDFVTQSSIYNI